MCVVSAVMDYGQKLWPSPEPWMTPLVPAFPIIPDVPPQKSAEERMAELNRKLNQANPAAAKEQGRLPTAAEIKAFQKLVEAAERFDAIANQPHCEDPEKIKLLQRLEERLARIEGAVGVVDEPAPAEASTTTIGVARIIYNYLTSSVADFVDFAVLEANLKHANPDVDFAEATRRAKAAYALLHGEAQ